ncbi:CrcB-like protein-domain-containing protein [Xylariaceae sp. FL0016]|nr:CrcB-like protein-domain-containing protein [Xylariaceae sp. FL0016]
MSLSVRQPSHGKMGASSNDRALHELDVLNKPRQSSHTSYRSSQSSVDYPLPADYQNLSDVYGEVPLPSPGRENHTREHDFNQPIPSTEKPSDEQDGEAAAVSRLATELYTISYLILFALLGTLARLGLQALTYYPHAPVSFSTVWPNFAGSLFLGFLAEDRKLFRFEWGTPTYDRLLRRAKEDEESGVSSSEHVAHDLDAAKKAHAATKKTIPLYIGLATGFCGSFTSFSAFIRDIFLAMSNDLPDPDIGTSLPSRNGGYSFMALLAVILTTVSLSVSGLYLGAHLAIVLEPFTPSFPYALTRKFVDPFVVFLAWGCWLGAVILSIFPPDRFRNSGASEVWRGSATFALVFAPLGCLGRFYASIHLNGRIASFPLGTFAVNILGTAVLGMAWDIAHVPVGGVIGCQVLEGVEDGFCGCLTTVSTWVAELVSLRRRHAYAYGSASVVMAFACLVAIMGGLKWTEGFSTLTCLH